MKLKMIVYILAAVAVALIVGGFFVPPMGEIDGSVLQGAGIIVGIIALLVAWDEVDKGMNAKFSVGHTTVELNKTDTIDV